MGRCQDNIHNSRQFHQCLNVGNFTVKFLGHVGKQVVNTVTEAVVGKIEINQDATDVDTKFAEPAIGQISVEKLQQQTKLLLLSSSQRSGQTFSSNEFHQQRISVFWLLSGHIRFQNCVQSFAVFKFSQ